MHIARVCEKLPRLQIHFRISRSFRPRNNLRPKILSWNRRKEHTLVATSLLGNSGYQTDRKIYDQSKIELRLQSTACKLASRELSDFIHR